MGRDPAGRAVSGPRKLGGADMSDANEATFRGLARRLASEGRSATTVAAYHHGLRSLENYLEDAGRPAGLLDVTPADVEDWLIALRDAGGWARQQDGTLARTGRPLAADSVRSYWRSVNRFYNWALGEELIDASPMAGMREPAESGKPLPIPDIGVVRAMLESCRPKGRKPDFYDRRDEFMIRLLCEPGGIRCNELARLPMEHLDMRADLVTVHGKGGKWRRFPLSPRTADAAARYLRARDRHPGATSPQVLLGLRGALTHDGVRQAIARRSEAAGCHIHPHQFRHFAADASKTDEMTDSDIMTLFGWSTPKMLERYGRERKEQRAIEAARRHDLGSRL